MPRGTEAEVKKINRETAWIEEWVTPFLENASTIVDNAYASDDYNAITFRRIEVALAAYLVELADPEIVEEKTGDATAKYPVLSGEGLAASRYGRMVMALDYKGILVAAMASQGQAIIEAVEISTS